LIRTFSTNKPNSALRSVLFFCVLVLTISCSSATRNLFFDIPPPEPEDESKAEPDSELMPESQSPGAAGGLALYHPSDLEIDRPEIEDVMDWEQALELLPKDEKGNADWVAALRDGTIKPRALEPSDRAVESFRLDFFLKAKKPKNDAFFPHSIHLEWMGCDSCHPAVFRYRDNEISMKTMRKGKFCGACHGSVAFSAKACKRCHLDK
jgi:c(7)-type cytochrome triheme protein